MTSHANHTTEHTLWCGIPAEPAQREKVLTAVEEKDVSGFVWQAERFTEALDEGAYDETLREGPEGKPPTQALALMVDDAQRACRLLASLAESSDGDDGIVSVPLVRESPAERWVEAAARLAHAIDCPNVAFAIVADDEGLNALTDLIAAGYRTDVVGVVTCDQMRRADEAYVEGLARRLDQGPPLSSVGSTVEMPIATIDNAINARLDTFAADEDPIPPDESEIDKPWPGEGTALRGEVAVAYAKLCYAEHQERIKAGEFARLIGLGAHPQRIRFAALTNIDPPIVYAHDLTGPGVVLTADVDNLDAIANVESNGANGNGIAEASDTLERLADIHQDLDDALQEAFGKASSSTSQAWDRAVDAVERRMKHLQGQA